MGSFQVVQKQTTHLVGGESRTVVAVASTAIVAAVCAGVARYAKLQVRCDGVFGAVAHHAVLGDRWVGEIVVLLEIVVHEAVFSTAADERLRLYIGGHPPPLHVLGPTARGERAVAQHFYEVAAARAVAGAVPAVASVVNVERERDDDYHRSRCHPGYEEL